MSILYSSLHKPCEPGVTGLKLSYASFQEVCLSVEAGNLVQCTSLPPA